MLLKSTLLACTNGPLPRRRDIRDPKLNIILSLYQGQREAIVQKDEEADEGSYLGRLETADEKAIKASLPPALPPALSETVPSSQPPAVYPNITGAILRAIQPTLVTTILSAQSGAV